MTSQSNFVDNAIQLNLPEQEEIIVLNQPIPTGYSSQDESAEMATDDSIRKRTLEHTGNKSSSEEAEGWNLVSRGSKARKDEEVILVQICVTSQKDLPKQFALAKILQQQKIDNITKVKYVSSTKMILTFDKETCAEEFVKCMAFVEREWKCQKTSEVGVSYGVIKNMDLDLTEEAALEALSSPIQIISAKRLNRRNSEESGAAWIKSESIRLGFKGDLIPTHVFVHGMRIKVDTFVFPVTQCGRCWKFGHTSKFCPSKKIVCPKCTKKHENCENTTFVCVNCRGPHMAMQKSCPVFKKERRIRELMSEFNVTYRKAQSMYVPPTPIGERLTRPPRQSEDTDQDPFETEYEQRSMMVDEPTTPEAAPSHLHPNIEVTFADKLRCRGKQYKPVKKILIEKDTGSEEESEQDYVPEQHAKGQNQDTGLEVGKARKKHTKSRRSVKPHGNTSTISDCNMEQSDNSEENQDQKKLPIRDERKYKRSENNDSENSFSRLLLKLKDIIFGNYSFSKKLELAGKICIEWLIPKVMSCMSAGTFFCPDPNYG